jgi:hypothetical protein
MAYNLVRGRALLSSSQRKVLQGDVTPETSSQLDEEDVDRVLEEVHALINSDQLERDIEALEAHEDGHLADDLRAAVAANANQDQ